MSEQARKFFDIEEQKLKDVLTVIKTITPVIPLIREWGETEKELLSIEKYKKSLKQEIDTIDATIKLLTGDITGNIIGALAEEHDKRCREYREIQSRCEKFRKKCENFESEVISYQEYARLYNWINTIDIEKAIINGEEFLAIMFLLYNRGINFDCEFDYIRKKFPEKVDSYGYLRSWNMMLESIKENKI